jgi:hypothetical protein
MPEKVEPKKPEEKKEEKPTPKDNIVDHQTFGQDRRQNHQIHRHHRDNGDERRESTTRKRMRRSKSRARRFSSPLTQKTA